MGTERVVAQSLFRQSRFIGLLLKRCRMPARGVDQSFLMSIEFIVLEPLGAELIKVPARRCAISEDQAGPRRIPAACPRLACCCAVRK